MIGIYKIVNKINNKIYIGQSINVVDRWKQHQYKSLNSKELAYNSAIHQAMRKYGIENFVFEIIEECSIDELDEKERYWISKLNTLSPNGYNILEGGQKVRKVEPPKCIDCGCEISKNAKRCRACQIKNQTKDRPEPLELAQMIIENGFEKTGRFFGVSGNAIKKWCKFYNIPHIKSDLKEWYYTQVNIIPTKKKPRQIPVKQIDINTGEVINIFKSSAEAARFLGVSKGSHITEVCKGYHKQAYGYFWQYA